MAGKARRVPDELLWLDGALPGRVQVHISGTSRALIENYLGVAEFTDACVRLRAKRGEVRVDGEGLRLCELRPGSMIVAGRICRVTLPEGSDA